MRLINRTIIWTREDYSQKNEVGVCGPLSKTLTLFITKICKFPYPNYDLTKKFGTLFMNLKKSARI